MVLLQASLDMSLIFLRCSVCSALLAFPEAKLDSRRQGSAAASEWDGCCGCRVAATCQVYAVSCTRQLRKALVRILSFHFLQD